MANKINYQLNFTTDRSNLTNIKNDLEAIQQLTAKGLFDTGSFKSLNEADIKLKEIQKEAAQVQQALEKSFNSNLGTLNITKFNNELKDLNINKIQQDFYSLGKTGQQAFRDMTTQVLTTNLQLKQSYNWLDQMSKTMSNTIKWGIASSAMNSFTGSIQSAYSFVKKLDTSLNDIRIVTNKSADEMSKFAQNATKAAKELGASTLDYTQGSLIYYQQGFGDEETKARAETTLKAANVTGQTGAEVSEQLTAVWNGYKVTASETELYVDKLAAVAASTASDLEELSTGMSKVASAANSAGVDIDQLNAQLATIISVTREAPETVGSSLRTIYARLGDLALDGEDEYGVTLGNVSSQMEQLGIQIVDQQGNLRDMGDIIEDTAKKWQTWTDAQKQAAAVAMGGKMQYSRLIALFDNWGMYTDALETSANAMGTLQNQQDIYMESTEAHLQKLNTSWEHFYNSLSEGDTFNELIDGVSVLVDGMSNFVEAIGGGKQALLMLGSIGSQVFSRQLAGGIATFVTNIQNAKENAKQMLAITEITNRYSEAGLEDNTLKEIINMKKSILDIGKTVTEEEHRTANTFINETVELEKHKQLLKDKNKELQESKNSIQNEVQKLTEEKNKIEEQNQALQQRKKEIKDLYDTKIIEPSLNFEESDYDSSLYIDEIKSFAEIYRTNIVELEKYKNTLQDVKNAEKAYALARNIENQKPANQGYLDNAEKIKDKKQRSDKQNEAIRKVTTVERELTNAREKNRKSLLNQVVAVEKLLERDKEEIKDGTKLGEVYKALQIYRQNPFDVNAMTLMEKYEAYLKSEVNDYDKLEQGLKNIDEQQEKYTKSIRDNEKALNEQQEALNRVNNDINKNNKSIRDNENKINNLSDAWEQFKKSIELRAQIEGIVQFASGLSQITSAMMTLSNLDDIITDDDLSTFEKTLQIIMALTSSIPMLVNGFSLIKKGFNTVKIAIAEAIIAEKGWIGANAKVIASDLALGESLKFVTAQVGKFLLVAGPYIAVGLAIVGGAYAIAKAWNADADAAKAANENVENLISAYTEAEIAANNLKTTISDYSEGKKALKDLDEGTTEYKNKLEETNNKAKELIETLNLYDKYSMEKGLIKIDPDALEDAQKQVEQAKNTLNQSLTVTRINAKQASLKSQETNLSRQIRSEMPINNMGKSPFIKREEEISDVLNQSKNQILSMNLREVANSLNELRDSAEEEYDIAKQSNESFKKFLTTSNKVPDNLKKYIDAIIDNRKEMLTFADSIREATEANKHYAKEILGSDIENKYGDILEGISKDSKGNIDENQYEEMITALTSIQANTDLDGKTFGERLSEIEVENTGYKGVKALGSSSISNREAGFLKFYSKEMDDLAKDFANINNKEDLTKLYASVIGKNTTSGTVSKEGDKLVLKDIEGNVIVEETEKAMSQVLQQYYRTQELMTKYNKELDSTQYLSLLEKLDKNKQKSLDEYGFDSSNIILDALANEGKVDLSSVFSELNPEQIENFKNMNNEEILNFFGITQEDLNNTGILAGNKFFEGLRNSAKDFNISDWYKSMAEKSAQSSKDVANVITGLQTGDLTRENYTEDSDEFKSVQTAMNRLKQAGIEMTGEFEILNKTWLVGTQEYQEALENVQNALYNLNIDSLVHSAEEASNDVEKELEKITDTKTGAIKVDADTDDFMDAMDKLMEADYSIDVAIHTEAEQEFDSIMNALENMEEQASKIGEDFIIAGEDIRSINQAFPGILDGMEYLADGSVKLNEEMVKSAMASAEAEAKADAQSTLDKLQNQASLLRAKQAAYARMANAAAVLGQNEALSAEESATAQETISKSLAEIEQLNSQLTADQEMTNDYEVVESSKVNAGILADNWRSAFQDQAQSSLEAARAAIQNMDAVARQDAGGLTSGTFKSQYSGSSGIKAEASIAEATNKALEKGASKKDWTALANQYRQMSESAGAAANDIEGMIAQIGARSHEIDTGLGNVARGKGFNYGKDNGGSNKDPDQKDYLEDEKDLYHDINIALEQISKNLDRLQKQEKKLFGQKLLDNLNKQLAQLNAKIDATNKKIGIARREAGDLQQELSAKGVQFRSDGTIANYNDAWNAQLTYTNQIITAYNSMDAEQQEAYKDIVEKAEEDFNKFTENIERYDEIVTEMIPELEDDIQEAVDEKIEIEISKFKMKIDISLDLHQAKKDWLDFKKDIIDKVAEENLIGNFGADLAQFSSYFDGSIQRLTQHIQDTLAQARQMDATGWSDVYGDNQAQLLEDLKTYQDDLMEYLKDLEDLKDQMAEYYSQAMDAAKDAFDRQNEVYEQVQKLYEHDMNLTKLIYGEDSYSSLAKYYDKLNENYNKQLDFQRQEKDLWEQQMNQAEKKMKDLEAAGQTNTKEWYQAKEEFEQAEDNWFNAVNTLNDTIEASVENLIDRYENAIDLIFQKVNNTLTGDKGLDYMSQQWDLLNEKSDQYLDNINRMYETQKIANKYLEAIDLTQSVSAQRELNKLMEGEIKYLREKDKLTQYDIDRAELRYQIALKQIALQEAQQNKTTMRLKRDSQGNYTYQYVADEDQIGAIQDELADLYNRLYNLDKDQVKNNLDEILQLLVDWEEEVKEATLAGDPERAAMLNKEYMDLMTAYETEYLETKKNLNESSLADMLYMYAQDTESYQNMTDEQKAILDAYLQGQKISFEDAYKSLFEQYEADKEKFSQVHDEEMNYMQETINPEWNSVVTDMADKFGGDGDNSLKTIMLNAYNKITEATTDYENKLNETQQIAGIDFENIRNAIDQTAIRTQSLAYDNAQLIGTYQSLFYTLQNLIQALANTISMYQGAQAAAQAAATDAYNYWTAAQNAALSAQNLAQQASYATSEIYRLKTAVDALNASIAQNATAASNAASSGGGSLGGGNTSSTNKNTTSSSSSNGTPSGPYLTMSEWKAWYKKQNRVSPNQAAIARYAAQLKSAGRSDLLLMNTGGYTGEWNSNEGKLAILHEKELVLNKEDTANILETVGIVRNIASSLKSSLYDKVSSMIGGIGTPTGNIQSTNEKEILEQNVHIEASFPNVTNSHEVEDALNNLVNTASQRINKRKR